MRLEGYHHLAHLLLELERHMRALSLWAGTTPPAERLASNEPFCVDTLSFPEWLQFIFLPRMRVIIEVQTPLPFNSQIAPMAEEYFRGKCFLGVTVDASSLCFVLRHIDHLIGLSSEA